MSKKKCHDQYLWHGQTSDYRRYCGRSKHKLNGKATDSDQCFEFEINVYEGSINGLTFLFAPHCNMNPKKFKYTGNIERLKELFDLE